MIRVELQRIEPPQDVQAADKYFIGNAQPLKRLETVAEAWKDNAKVVKCRPG